MGPQKREGCPEVNGRGACEHRHGAFLSVERRWGHMGVGGACDIRWSSLWGCETCEGIVHKFMSGAHAGTTHTHLDFWWSSL